MSENSTGTLAKYTVWNLVGMCLPMVVALVAIPVLTYGGCLGSIQFAGLGKERLYVLGLIWGFVGYFSIFDMGLGRALTKSVAERLAQGKRETLPALFWTSLGLTVLLGCLAAIIMAAVSPGLAGWLKITDALRLESKQALWVAAAGMPLVVATIGLVGVLEACREFLLINRIRIFFGSFTFLGPLLVLPFSTSLVWVAAVLILGRVIECIVYLIACLVSVPEVRAVSRWKKSEAKALASFGGWMTVSNLTVPMMTNVINRVLTGILRAAEIGANYLVPEEMAVRLLIIPRAWVSALFPSFVSELNNAKKDASLLFCKGVYYLLFAMMPVTLAILVLSREGLALWMGAGFAQQSTQVLQLLVIGVFLHGIARVAWFYVQAAGRPDLSAKAHLVQLPLTILLAWVLISRYGIRGAALAWAVRAGVDLVVMLVFAARFLTDARRILLTIGGSLLSSLILMAAVMMLGSLWGRLAAGCAGVLVWMAGMWVWALSHELRDDVVVHLKGMLSSHRDDSVGG